MAMPRASSWRSSPSSICSLGCSVITSGSPSWVRRSSLGLVEPGRLLLGGEVEPGKLVELLQLGPDLAEKSPGGADGALGGGQTAEPLQHRVHQGAPCPGRVRRLGQAIDRPELEELRAC